MADAYGIPTDLTTLLDKVAAALVAAGVADANYVYPSFEDDEEFASFPDADRFVILRPLKFAAMRSHVSGGGRATFALDGPLRITLWARLGIDQHKRAGQWLKHATAGAWAKWKAVLSAMEQFAPADSGDATQKLVIAPIRLINFDFGKRKPRQGWGKIAGEFDVKYVQVIP